MIVDVVGVSEKTSLVGRPVACRATAGRMRLRDLRGAECSDGQEGGKSS